MTIVAAKCQRVRAVRRSRPAGCPRRRDPPSASPRPPRPSSTRASGRGRWAPPTSARILSPDRATSGATSSTRWTRSGKRKWNKNSVCHSVADPDPQDPYVFWPPGSGSIRSGSRSFCNQAIIIINPTVLWLLYQDPDPLVRGERYGSADPEPNQNVKDPQHWLANPQEIPMAPYFAKIAKRKCQCFVISGQIKLNGLDFLTPWNMIKRKLF